MNRKVRVWDSLIRIFHWSLVAFFTIAYLTGEEESDLHIYSGYIVLGLIMFRLVWGFIGSRYARFSSFVTPPGQAVEYLANMAGGGDKKRYIGHNPAGGWMIIIMIVTLLVVSVSGLKVYAIEEGKGPLAMEAPNISLISSAHADGDERYERYEKYEEHEEHEEGEYEGEEHEEEEFWEEIHEASSNLMLLLIFLHVVGVVLSGRQHNENLVKAMFTGYKENR